jgi:hypothetical protein
MCRRRTSIGGADSLTAPFGVHDWSAFSVDPVMEWATATRLPNVTIAKTNGIAKN